MKFRYLVLKSLPYILSMSAGIIVHAVSISLIKDHSLNNLLNEIAGSLLAIPVVFVIYELVNYKMSSNVNREMAASLMFDVNAIVLKVLKELRYMLMPKSLLNWNMINKMLRMRAREIRAVAQIADKNITQIKAHKKELNDLSYKLVRIGILSERQIEMVIAMTKQMAHVVNEWEFKRNSLQLSKYVENLLEAIDDWFDSCERESLQSQQQFQLTLEQEIQKQKNPASKRPDRNRNS